MDTKKDIESKRTFSDYIKTPDVKTDVFGQNISGEEVFKRSERILSALYLLTNGIDAREPIRTSIRTKAHVLLDQSMSLRSGMRTRDDERVRALLASMRELVSYTHVLFVGGYTSQHNAQIMTQALDELGQFILTASQSRLAEGYALRRNDLVPTREPSVPQHTASSQAAPALPAAVQQKDAQSRPVTRPKRVDKEDAQNERRETILHILRRGGTLGIKDISSQIVGCSDKTVQRELAVLAESGLIRKEGSKRWVRYSIL